MPLNIDFQQILLHILNFLILVLGLYVLLYAPIVKFMEKRKAKYAQQANQADENLKKSEELLNERNESLKKLKREMAELRKEKMADIKLEGEKYIEQAKMESRAIKEKALNEASITRKLALENVNAEMDKIIEKTLREAIINEDAIYQEFMTSAKSNKKADVQMLESEKPHEN